MHKVFRPSLAIAALVVAIPLPCSSANAALFFDLDIRVVEDPENFLGFGGSGLYAIANSGVLGSSADVVTVTTPTGQQFDRFRLMRFDSVNDLNSMVSGLWEFEVTSGSAGQSPTNALVRNVVSNELLAPAEILDRTFAAAPFIMNLNAEDYSNNVLVTAMVDVPNPDVDPSKFFTEYADDDVVDVLLPGLTTAEIRFLTLASQLSDFIEYGVDIDGTARFSSQQSSPSTIVSITAIPEPSSVIMLTCFGTFALTRRKLRC